MSTNTLREYLKTIDKDQIVAIGASNGENFVYIGKAGDVDLIEKEFNNCLEEAYDRVAKNRKELEEVVYAKPRTGKDEDETRKNIYAYANRIRSMTGVIKLGERYIGEFKPVLERNVKLVYKKTVDNCIGVIVVGMDKGKYWLKEEFDKDHMG